VREVAPGVWRWTAAHPAWEPDQEPESPGDWPEQVGCVLYEAPEGPVLVDPLVADWAPLDDRVAGRPVTVLTTLRFHGRSREAVLERYGGRAVRHDGAMPSGVEAIPVVGFDETMYWLPEPRALIPGDRLLGTPDGGVRMCPESWLGYISKDATVARLREALRPVLALPVQHVLLSHGEPVLGGGRLALARALGGT
jgi:hypothetical protein